MPSNAKVKQDFIGAARALQRKKVAFLNQGSAFLTFISAPRTANDVCSQRASTWDEPAGQRVRKDRTKKHSELPKATRVGPRQSKRHSGDSPRTIPLLFNVVRMPDDVKILIQPAKTCSRSTASFLFHLKSARFWPRP